MKVSRLHRTCETRQARRLAGLLLPQNIIQLGGAFGSWDRLMLLILSPHGYLSRPYYDAIYWYFRGRYFPDLHSGKYLPRLEKNGDIISLFYFPISQRHHTAACVS